MSRGPTALTRRKATPPREEWGQLRLHAQTNLYGLAKVLLGYRDMTDGFHLPACEWWAGATEPHKLLMLPRDHFKTSVFTIAANVQRVLNAPATRLLIASNKAENAQAMLAELKGHLQNPVLQWLFPDVLWSDPARQAPKWTTDAITVRRPRQTKEATIETIGVEGELTSKHYDHMTFDDLVGFENSQTRDQLERTIRWYRSAQGLCEPWTTQDIIGCLPSDAEVLLENGETKPIELMKPGDRVWAADVDGSLAIRTVTALIPQGEAPTVTVRTTSKELRATPEHPFLVCRRGRLEWVRASDLIPGEYIVSIKEIPGSLRPERVISVTLNQGTEAVYDLSVDGTPSFFANGLAVHNTPWHYADIYAWLQEQRAKQGLKVAVYKRPAWEEVRGERVPTFPERFSLEALLERRGIQGPSVFAAQMLLDPVDDETTLFPRKTLTVRRRDLLPDPRDLWCAMTIDPAISTKGWADYSALAVGGFDRDGLCYLLDLRRGRWTDSQLMHHVYDAYARTPNIRVVGFEAVGFAKIYRRLFTAEGEKRGAFLPVVALERDTRITKRIRIRGLEPWWTNGSLIVAADCQALDDFLDEAERFRPDKESAHDDLLDAVVDLIQLRARPAASPQPTTDAFLDDPEAYDRQQFEIMLQERRQRNGQTLLDRTSLRALWHQRQLRRLEEERRESEALGVATGEFWG